MLFEEAVCGAVHQAAGIQHVLGLELALRPAAAGLEFDAQEVADLAVYAVPHFAEKLAFGIGNLDDGLQRNWPVHLQAGAGERNVGFT